MQYLNPYAGAWGAGRGACHGRAYRRAWPAPQADDILRSARQFVFRVRNEACLGTGTAFETSGTIITNRHVAAGAGQIDLATWDGNDFQSQVSTLDGAARSGRAFRQRA